MIALLGVEELLDAEAAADVGRHDAQLVLRNVQHEVAHQHLHDMRELAGGPHRVMVAAGIVLRHCRARLHRIADQAIVHQADLGDMSRVLERRCRRLGVAALPVEADVVGDVVEHGGSAGSYRVEHADDGRQHLIVDLDRIRRFARLLERVGDHERHRVADASHLADAPSPNAAAPSSACHRLRDRPSRRAAPPTLSAARSAPVKTAATPGSAAAALMSIPLDHRVRVRRAQEHAHRHVRPLDVSNVVAACR